MMNCRVINGNLDETGSLARLAEICEAEKKVTTYFAQYSWANIAKDLEYSKGLIAEALGMSTATR
jgi:hypothetical protein